MRSIIISPGFQFDPIAKTKIPKITPVIPILGDRIPILEGLKEGIL
jgi:hypothetical protein